MRIRDGIVLGALIVVAAALLAATPAARRFELVPGPLLESAQFLFKVDTETGRVWWTVVGPSKKTGRMYVSTWNPIPESQQEAASLGESPLLMPPDASATDPSDTPTSPAQSDPEP